jgi:rhodanese-related sulfurtransferase
MESTCYLLRDEHGKDTALFSGDTLFLGDVGRPDLAQKAADMTQEQLAATLYRSLREVLMPLADDITVYPGHGAGSACGKNMSKETVGSLGEQKATNYALRADMTEAEFVREVTDGLAPPPAYFPLNVAMNKKSIPGFEDLLAEHGKVVDPTAFVALAEQMEALVLDTRDAESFANGHIPGSINIGLDGQFAPWVGALIPDIQQNILVVAAEGREEETIKRLARVGYDRVLGYLEGGFASWLAEKRDFDTVKRINADELAAICTANPQATILDVRKKSENYSERLPNAINLPLDDVSHSFSELPEAETLYIHCAGGYRSMIFASILKSRGVHNLVDVRGGFGAIKNAGLQEVTAYMCPSTML